jgi:hypothetical protein
MPPKYEYIPHPHIAVHKLQGPARTIDERRINHPNPIIRFNARLGLGITVVVGTMWCAYLFSVIALLSAPSAFNSGNLTIIIAWISSNFLQLVLLPIIIVGQNIQAKASDKRAEDTYKDAGAILHEAMEIQKHLAAQDDEIERILTLVKSGSPS